MIANRATNAGHRLRNHLDASERIVLVAFLGLLASRLVPHLADTPVNVVHLMLETVVVMMIAFRRRTDQVSVRPADWLIGFGGTFLPLMVAPSGTAGVPAGGVLMVFGFALSAGAQLSLRRSFGVVAANRGVKTSGLYTIVRHPMYVGYFFSYTGFLLVNPSVWNGVICGIWAACQFYRIEAEERVLSGDHAYVEFQHRVRYRLVPFVY